MSDYLDGRCLECRLTVSHRVLNELDGFCAEECKAAALLKSLGPGVSAEDNLKFLRDQMSERIEGSLLPFRKLPLSAENLSAIRSRLKQVLLEEFSAEITDVKMEDAPIDDMYMDGHYVFRVMFRTTSNPDQLCDFRIRLA